jgi:RNA polymerase sigma-70 factor (ECF subfamily)
VFFVLLLTTVMAPWTDADLVALIAGRSERQSEAEQVVCERYGKRILLYGLRHLGGEDDAQDLVQQVLVVLLEALRAGKVEEPERLPAFVMGTCRFAVWDRRRGERRRQEVASQAAATEPIAVETSFLELDRVRLHRCMKQLPAREQAVVRLSYNEDLSAEEVAAALELSPVNVRVIRHRCLQRLAACIEGAPAEVAT